MRIHTYLIALLLCFSTVSCSDWLDLQPQDTTDEDQLFETGDGYRNALNGIYKQMATSGMYGKELMWGTLDAMAQYYSPHYGTVEAYASEYEYANDNIKPIIKNVWSTAYNSIANCNNLIQRISEASPTLFRRGEDEKNLIQGEALALRAILHFDLLRLFAPGPELNDGGKYLPYVESYPITFQEYITNDEFLEKVIRDLKAAKDLVGSFDIPRVQWMMTSARFEGDLQGITIDDEPDELFVSYRGYRMNYWAICGMLARVYTYAKMYKEAFDETEIVLNATYDDYGQTVFSFGTNRDGNTKLYDELIFCLSNQKLVEDYKSYNSTYELTLETWDPLNDWFDGEGNDWRYKLLTEKDYNYVSTKYTEVDGKYYQYAKDMIPMLRIGELYLIRAEYYYRIGAKEKALEELATLRRGHNCGVENVDTEGDDWFNTAIINEARREFIQEGQLYFLHKRLNIFPTRSFSAELFRWPLPDNEEF